MASMGVNSKPSMFLFGTLFCWLQDGMATSQHTNPRSRLTGHQPIQLLQSNEFRYRTFSSFKMEADFNGLPRVLMTTFILLDAISYLLKIGSYLCQPGLICDENSMGKRTGIHSHNPLLGKKPYCTNQIIQI